MNTVELKNVSKKFNLIHEKDSMLIGKSEKEDFYALKNINLAVKKGECLGIIGPNGSGKTTLLKVIAGILSPTKGNVKVNGKVLTFLDTGSGFREELTGKENVFLYGSILGMSTSEIKKNFSRIVDFSQLEKFINVKLKDYSTGMKLRLAFAIAMSNNPEVILIDEILAVGDEEFQKKSLNRIRIMKEQGKTMVIVSHDMSTVREICDRAIFLEHGVVKSQGVAQKVILDYLNHSEKSERVYNYFLLKKNFKSYLSVSDETQKLRKDLKRKINLPIIDSFMGSRLEKQLESLGYRKATLRSQLIDLCDMLIILPDKNYVWLENKVKNFSPQQKKELLENLKQAQEALNIKQIVTKKSFEFEEILLGIRLLEMEVQLQTAEKEREEVISRVFARYKEGFNHVDKPSAVYLRKYMFDFLISHRIDNSEFASILHSIKECKNMLKTVPHFDPEDNENQISGIIRTHLHELHELISVHKLELEEAKPAEKKKIEKELERLLEFRKELTKLSISVKEDDEKEQRPVRITNVVFLDSKEEHKELFYTGEQVKIKIMFDAEKKVEKPVFGITIHGDDGTQITGPNTKFHNIEIPYVKGKGSVSYIIDKLPLLEGTYLVSAAVHPYNSFTPYDLHDKRYSFEVKSREIRDLGIVYLDSRWEINK